MTAEFQHWPKIPRAANVECYITEKIDGTNAQIFIPKDKNGCPGIGFFVGSRNRWITPDKDNYGFARWAYENAELLLRLGEGAHYGEWWGAGVQRGYGLTERRFSLFDTRRWNHDSLAERGLDGLVSVVPMLATCGLPDLGPTMARVQSELAERGSVAAPGFMRPEGIVVAFGGMRIKVTGDGDVPKWQNGIHNPEVYKPGVLIKKKLKRSYFYWW